MKFYMKVSQNNNNNDNKKRSLIVIGAYIVFVGTRKSSQGMSNFRGIKKIKLNFQSNDK